MKLIDRVKNEKGFILVLALVTMLAMTLIGLSVVMNMTTDMQLSRNEREAKIAFQLAESGLREASARLHMVSTNAKYIGEKTASNATYNATQDAGGPPNRSTAWNSGGYKDFTSSSAVIGTLDPNKSYSVTIKYLDETNPEGFCDSNNVPNNDSTNATVPPASCQNSPAEVVMYGQDFNLNSSVTYIKYGMLPVYKVTSTGVSNGTSRTVVAYLGESNLNTDTDHAINTNSCISVNGGSNAITGSVVQGPGCACDPMLSGGCSPDKTATTDMNTYLGDTLANIATYADEVHSCTTATCNGAGDDIPSSGKLDNVVTNWGDFAGHEGTLLYINNTGGKQVEISPAAGTVDGEGILIVTGDLKISGDVTWNGLIYVLGTLTLSGSLNVEGGVMTNNTVTLNGSVTVKYDLEELQEVSRQTSTSATMVWKRL